MALKRKFTGGFLAFIGFMLSPLSWWNDAFVNLPLALAFAWLVSWPFAKASKETVFDVSVIVGYWLTNVLGFVLMHKGAQQIVAKENDPRPQSSLKRDLLVSLAYTALILILLKLGVLRPLEGYHASH